MPDSSPTDAISPPAAASPGTGQVQFAPGTATDHPAIERLLSSVFPHHQFADRWQAALDDPLYEPCDRLLARQSDRLLAHVQVSPRVWHAGPLALKTSHLSWLATDARFRRGGLAAEMLLRAEQHALAQGSLLVTAWCTDPSYFLRRGFVKCAERGFHQLHPQHMLANLPEPEAGLTIRPWRRCEGSALVDLHTRRSQSAWGAFARTEAVWQWLVSQQPPRLVYVATDGPERRRGGPEVESLAGYLVMQGNRILELGCRPADATVPLAMLSRVCRDAVERGEASLSLIHPAPCEWEACLAATPTRPEPPHATLVAKPLNLPRLLTSFAPGLTAIARRATPAIGALGLILSIERAAHANGTGQSSANGNAVLRALETLRGQWIFERRRHPKFAVGNIGRSYISTSPQDLLLLLLGAASVEELAGSGRLQVSNKTAERSASALFTPRPAWVSPLDDAMTSP